MVKMLIYQTKVAGKWKLIIYFTSWTIEASLVHNRGGEKN
jgi:hypothetical protein